VDFVRNMFEHVFFSKSLSKKTNSDFVFKNVKKTRIFFTESRHYIGIFRFQNIEKTMKNFVKKLMISKF
jgi:hypothetical protein